MIYRQTRFELVLWEEYKYGYFFALHANDFY
jgi:hypothetical protein